MASSQEENQTQAPSRFAFWVRSGVLTVALFGVGLMVMQFLGKKRKPPRRTKAPALTTQVSTLTIQPRSKLLYIEGFGTVVATQQVRLVPEVSGIVRATVSDFKPGRLVKKGQLLVRLDQQSYALEFRRLQAQQVSLKKQLALGQKALRLDRLTLQRNEQLLRDSAVDKNSVDQMRMRIREREQRQETLRQTLSMTYIQMQSANLQIQRSRIRAPFNARVVSGGVDVGGYAAQGQPLATLESVDSVDIPVGIPQHTLLNWTNDKGELLSPQDIPTWLRKLPRVQVSLGSSPKLRWKGRVVRVGGSLDSQTRTVDLWVRVKLSPKTGGALLTGTYCQVRIPYRRIHGAITLPRQAVYGATVYVVEKGRLQPRRVTVVHRNADSVVIGAGLSKGEEVVTSYLLQPVPGMRVVVQKETNQ
ncbi:MAG: efflux RND transporter periplasmic adaptor subunit [Deltaproteobacteria bacterium]|nr:MAG: efflux RND transporter periplasmic adaptor subunit [Deltaproteobacteria bacterium]